MNKNYKGIFVTFEGLDFNGKTTQLELLEDYINSLWVKVVTYREPGGTRIGEKIRELLSDLKNMDMNFETELMLFNASRSQFVGESLIPALKRGDIIISDNRY